MKKITVTTLLALAGVVLSGSAFAQIRHEIRAYVPFEFSVGNKVLPAGNYSFDSVTSQSLAHGVLIRNVDQPRYSVLLQGRQAPWEIQPIYVAQHTRLVFDDYNGEHFLREVRGPLAAVNVEIPKSKAEEVAARKQMASASGLRQTTVGVGE